MSQVRLVIAVFALALTCLGHQAAPEMKQDDSTPTFQSKVNLVLVPVVVRDGRGKAIGNLTKADFELFDKGKQQTIASFQVVKRGGSANVAPGETTEAKAPEATIVAPDRYVAYVFDDLNIQVSDLMVLKTAAIKHVQQGLQPNDRAAVYTTSGQTMLDFTDDKAKLEDAISKIHYQALYQHAGRQCPDLTYYWADLIANKHDTNALNAAIQETYVCASLDPTQPGSLQMATQMSQTMAQQEIQVGEQGTRVTLSTIKNIIRRMGAKPGQRLVVMASPGFLTETAEALEDKTQIIDLAATMNVMVSSLNARGLYTQGGDASQPGSYSQQAQVLISQYEREADMANEDVLAELADGTGGKYVHNSNDLAGGFADLATAPEVSYILGFSPALLKPDGSYHKLRVTLVTSKGSNIQARRGYYAVKRTGDAEADAKADIEDAVFSREEIRDIPVDLETRFFKPNLDSAKLTVVARVDLRRLPYRKLEGRNRDDLTVVAVLFDRNGNYLKGTSRHIEMRLRDETLARLPPAVSVKQDFDVTPGGYVIRLVVRDSEGKEMAAQNGAVEIP